MRREWRREGKAVGTGGCQALLVAHFQWTYALCIACVGVEGELTRWHARSAWGAWRWDAEGRGRHLAWTTCSRYCQRVLSAV